MKMSKNPKDCAADTLPKRLLDWGTSQLQKIEKEIKQKKTVFKKENYSELTKETKHSCSKKKKQTVVFEEDSEEKQMRPYYTHSRIKSKNFDSECEKLEMSETKDVKHKNKKKKNDKCELVSVNIELKKGDRSYKTNISDTKIKLSKKRKDKDNDNEEKITCVKKKKKNSLLEANENINNEESYLIGIKVTKLDDTCIKETGNKDLKLKSKKRKKIDIYSSDTKKQGEIVEMGENELSPRKKKKKKTKHKDKNKESGASKEESNLEISDTNEFTCKKKRKNKSVEHVEKNILSDVNQMENDVNKEMSVYTKKEKGKKRICLENEDQSITVHKKKKKSKEISNHSELDTHLEDDLVSETDLNTSSCVQSQKKKTKKKNIDVMEEISSEIYIKKKKKKRKKDTESLDGVFSVSCSSISSYKTDGTGKSGMNFGKSPISRLLSNQELCSSCCGVNIKCSKICSNSSKNSTSTDTNSSANKQEESNQNFNDTQLDAIQNSSVICKQNKFYIDVQNDLPANITIKQEKIDEPEHPADICKEMTTLSKNVQVEQELLANHGENVGNLSNATIKQEKIDELELPADICKERTTHENVQVKQEICDISTNHGENFGNLSTSNVTHNGNGTHEIENVGNNNVSNILTSSNNINTGTSDNINNKNCCLNKIQDKQIHWDSDKQYFLDACETYYNFCDNKLTLHDEIDVCSEIQNQNNSLGETEVEKTNSIVNNEDILQGKKSHHVSCEADNSHPYQNANTINSVINGEEVLGEICHNNYSMIKIENNDVSHCVTTNTEGVIEESMSLGNISSDKDQYNQSDSGTNTRTFHQENNLLHMTVHQNLNKFQSYQHYQSTTESECRQLQSGQQYQGLIENECPQLFNKFQSNQNCQNPTETECCNQQIELKHEIHKNSSQSYHNSHKSKYHDESQSHSAIESLHFSCVRPPLKNKEHASRLLKVDKSQVELCYYRMCSKSYQDIHVKFSDRKHFEMVVRYYADRIRCKSWHIRQKESVQKKK